MACRKRYNNVFFVAVFFIFYRSRSIGVFRQNILNYSSDFGLKIQWIKIHDTREKKKLFSKLVCIERDNDFLVQATHEKKRAVNLCPVEREWRRKFWDHLPILSEYFFILPFLWRKREFFFPMFCRCERLIFWLIEFHSLTQTERKRNRDKEW